MQDEERSWKNERTFSRASSIGSIDDEKVQATIKLANTSINHGYLIYWSLFFSMASYLQVGYLVGEHARVRYVVAAKLNWNEDEAFLHNSIFTISAIVFVGIGSMLAS